MADLEKREQQRKEWWNGIHELNRCGVWFVYPKAVYMYPPRFVVFFFVFFFCVDAWALLSFGKNFSGSRKRAVAWSSDYCCRTMYGQNTAEGGLGSFQEKN